jgi:hypothetical protein
VSRAVAFLVVVLTAAQARAEPRRHECLDRLDELGVPYKPAAGKPGVAVPVEVTGPLGGVTWRSWSRRPLVVDCSLVFSLVHAGRFLTEAGITEAFYSSAYARRNVRGTNTPSRHSYGLAVDVHVFAAAGGPELSVADDFEQGLGDAMDCVGEPLTPAGTTLKLVTCRLERSGLFRLVLTPDFDEDHWNHLHLEALPWKERRDTAPLPGRVSSRASSGRPSPPSSAAAAPAAAAPPRPAPARPGSRATR